jgi:hypothetical protein
MTLKWCLIRRWCWWSNTQMLQTKHKTKCHCSFGQQHTDSPHCSQKHKTKTTLEAYQMQFGITNYILKLTNRLCYDWRLILGNRFCCYCTFFGKQILLQLHTNFEKQTNSAANCTLILEKQTKPAANCTPILEKQTNSAANCSLWLVQTDSAVISTADSSFKHCNLQYHRRCLHSQTVELAG